MEVWLWSLWLKAMLTMACAFSSMGALVNALDEGEPFYKRLGYTIAFAGWVVAGIQLWIFLTWDAS